MTLRVLAPAAGLPAFAWVTAHAFFTTDDHVFLWQDREQPFGARFLSEPIYDHLSPWHRLNDHLVALAGADHRWWPAALLAGLWFVATLVAASLLVRELVGDHPAGVAALVLVAVSPVFPRAGQWWALAAQQLPQLCFGLLSVWAALVWVRRDRRRRFLVLALLAYALALLGFIKALLVLPALVAVLGRPRRRDAPLWAGAGVLTVLYLAAISSDRYYRFIGDEPGAGAARWLDLLRAGLLEGTVPPVFGATSAADPGALTVLVVVACLAALAALVVATSRRSRRALRAWLGALVIAVAALVMSGGARLSLGVDFVALDPRYAAEGILATQVALAVAVASAWPALRMRLPLAVLAAVVVAVLVADSALRLERTWVAPRHEAWFARLSASAGELRARGARPAVLDGVTPGFLVAQELTGLNLLSKVVPLREHDLVVGALEGTPVLSAQDGTLRPVALRTVLDGSLAELARRGRLFPPPDAAGRVCLDGDGPRSLALRVDAPPGPELRVLELRFAPLERPFEGVLVTDSGSRGPNRAGAVVLPPVVTTYPRVPARRTGLRFVAGASRLKQLSLTADGGRTMCVTGVAVRSVPVSAAG